MSSNDSEQPTENTSLLDDGKKKIDEFPNIRPPRVKRDLFSCFLMFCAALLFILGVLYLTYSDHHTSKTYSFIARNNYGLFAENYPFYGKYELVEPHISTTLTADDPSENDIIAWEIETSSGVYEYPIGNPVEVIFNSTGKLSIKWCSISSTTSQRRRRRLFESSSNFFKNSYIYIKIKDIISMNWIESSLFLNNNNEEDKLKEDEEALLLSNIRVNGNHESLKYNNMNLASSSGKSYVFGIYVRRELRTLSDSDRDAFFDAAEIVFRVPTTEGQALYGSKYYSAGYYGAKHNVLSGNTNCDHMHDGLGFVTSHSALTLMFEQTLQAINPRVTVPYWDYTIDITAYELSGELSSFFDSEIFGEDYFGSAVTTIPEDDIDDDTYAEGIVDPSGRILTGRFTKVEMSLDYWGITSNVYNAYGHIRSPWNNNNDPYVNRFNTTYGFWAVGSGGDDRRRRLHADTPSSRSDHRQLEGSSVEFGSVDCGTVYTAMQYATWYDFGKKIEYQPHGPVHTLIGGVYGADYNTALSSRANVDSKFVEAWALLAFGLFKDMWRSGKVECPTSCSDDTPITECKCYCPNLDRWTANSTYANDYLRRIDPQIFGNAEFTTDLDGNDISIIILNVLCNAYDELNPVIGESLQSSSPMDITFWPTHPFIDRLFHWKLIHTGFHITTWGPGEYDTNYTCYGHSKTDRVGWKNLFDEDNYEYSNIELYDQSDPTVKNIEDYGLNYVYDNFLWEHCTSLGYPATLFDI